MEPMPRPHFDEVTMRSVPGITVRAASETYKDPVFDQSAPIQSRRQLFSPKTFRDATTETEVDVPQVEQPVVVAVSSHQNTVPTLEEEHEDDQADAECSAPHHVTEVSSKSVAQRVENWQQTAKAIAGRIKSQTIEDEGHSRPSVIEYSIRAGASNDALLGNATLRRTIVQKIVEEKQEPDFVRKARAMSGAAASKIDPECGNLVRGAKPNAAVESTAVPEATQFPRVARLIAALVQPVVEEVQPVVPPQPVHVEPVVHVAAAAPVVSASVDHTDHVSTSSHSEPRDSASEEPEFVTEEDVKQAAKAEWQARATSIKQHLPELLDETTKTDLKREAMQRIREEHKMSGSLVSQLAKTPVQKTVRPTNTQKRNAYKEFAAAPSHVRDSWLPKPEPITAGFEVVEKTGPARSASSISSTSHPNEVSSQVFRSKSNVAPAENDESKVFGYRSSVHPPQGLENA